MSVNICRDGGRHSLEDTNLIKSSEALYSYLHFPFLGALKLLSSCTKQLFFAFIEGAKISLYTTPRNFQAPENKGRTCRDFLHNWRQNVCKCCVVTGSGGRLLRTRSRNVEIHKRRKNILIS